jgi:hypothetical protein
MARTRNTEADEVETVVDEVSKESRNAVTVTWRAGSREYSRTVHGEDFLALAQEFADKKKGTLV